MLHACRAKVSRHEFWHTGRLHSATRASTDTRAGKAGRDSEPVKRKCPKGSRLGPPSAGSRNMFAGATVVYRKGPYLPWAHGALLPYHGGTPSDSWGGPMISPALTALLRDVSA
ncbi:uncharacterized protein N7506_000548 [Penicillium brevicompactum]|uniref:uncharacterized protein n=1 Tax=Penicillium brevicompactum TaxID=5074 RepID=UPI00254226DC|nr:uncharacterized protein N7506_000548 [Penicillium brevicompactum]KAJ5347295.1 hypothetical protein N7506_000548 [Penicillium brevicompactum]